MMSAGVNQDQQTRDDRQIHLDLDTAGFGGKQMTTAQQLFHHPKKQLDRPVILPP
jgi:hypothetical protein